MKRAQIAYLADIPPKRFDLLAERDHLPFPKRGGGNYTFAEALALRLIALSTSVDGFGGISPADARSLVVNAMGWIADRYGSIHPSSFVGSDTAVWIAGAEFAGQTKEGDLEVWRAWFAGALNELPGWAAEQLDPSKPGLDALRAPHMSRVFSALNVTAAAYEVLTRADEMGISEDEQR